MQNKQIVEWFESLKQIWLDKDIEAVKELLAVSFDYYEDPFLPPLTSWEEVKDAWQEIKNQNIVSLSITPVATEGKIGVGEYCLQLKNVDGNLRESRGVYVVKLNDDGKATSFRQWWVVK